MSRSTLATRSTFFGNCRTDRSTAALPRLRTGDWGLRDYGTGSWAGGDPDCDHDARRARRNERRGTGLEGGPTAGERDPIASACPCGATREDQQLGLEPSPDAYVAAMVAVFAEVRRVLADAGTLWLNIGDSYAGSSAMTTNEKALKGKQGTSRGTIGEARPAVIPFGLKPKDLVGIPWRLAFALQADGWWLRSDIVWAKPNPMPESVTDRPTKAHEYIFMFSKGPWRGRVAGPIETRLSTEDARWLALLVDAEGNICVKRVAPKGDNSPQYGAQIAIGSTSRALLERARDIVGAGQINEREGTNAPMFYWQVSNKVAQDLLFAIYPHLIVKPRQARIAIHLESLLYHRGTEGKRRTAAENAALESLWERNKACNQFGQPSLADVPEPKYGKWGATSYWFDQEAVREKYERGIVPADGFRRENSGTKGSAAYVNQRGPQNNSAKGPDGRRVTAVKGADGSIQHRDGERWPNGGRNVRSVWEIATQPYPDAHFATFPEELPRRCILAGCPEWVCVSCGAPRTRLVEREQPPEPAHRQPPKRLDPGQAGNVGEGNMGFRASRLSGQEMNRWRAENPGTESWSDCGHGQYRPGTVLDPFLGSGTTAHVARKHGRKCVGIELNPAYAELAARRLQQLSLLADGAA